jgi:betaine-aldehyde dehydrogenase
MKNRHEGFVIGGKWQSPLTDKRADVFGPADGELVGSVPVATSGDIDRAIAAANAAHTRGDWPNASPEDRAAALQDVLDRCRDIVDEIARVAAIELGQPLTQTTARNQGVLALFAEAISSGLALERSELRHDQFTNKYALIHRRPVGVVGAITAFNAPFTFLVSKAVRALMAGCSVVVKPSVDGALQTLLAAEAFADSALPDGVFSMLPGAADAGEHLVAHPLVDMVSFTGSAEAGRRIAATCGANLKRSVMELGGKSAALVLDDADLDAALPFLVNGVFNNTGQICTATTRVLAHQSRYVEVVERLTEAAAALKAGPPLDPETTIGALISERQYERVAALVDHARGEGARVTTGGGRAPGTERGWFYAPTVLDQVENGMQIAQEEVFGPVVVVISVADEAEAIRVANDSRYGLHGAVFSADSDRVVRVASRIDTGTCAINSYGVVPSAPIGGIKDSGWGREGGPESIAEYTELRTLVLGQDAPTIAAVRKAFATTEE